MTNDEQYVPSDVDMRWQYVVKRMLDGATRTHAEQEYTRWLAARDAHVRADQAEARIRHLEDTARVLAKEALTAEDVRDEHRRGKAAAEARVAEEKRLRMKATAAATEAEARIKAVQHLIDQADKMGEWAITCTRLQWAIDGSAPQPGA